MDMKRNISVFLLTAFAFTLVPAVSFGQDPVMIPSGNPLLNPPTRPRNFVEVPASDPDLFDDDFSGDPVTIPFNSSLSREAVDFLMRSRASSWVNPFSTPSEPLVPPIDALLIQYNSDLVRAQNEFKKDPSTFTVDDFKGALRSIIANINSQLISNPNKLLPADLDKLRSIRNEANNLLNKNTNDLVELLKNPYTITIFGIGASLTGAYFMNRHFFNQLRTPAYAPPAPSPLFPPRNPLFTTGSRVPVGGGGAPVRPPLPRLLTYNPSITPGQVNPMLTLPGEGQRVIVPPRSTPSPNIVAPRFVFARAAIPALVLVSTLTGPFKAFFTEGLTIPEYWTISSYREKLAEYNKKVPEMNGLLGQQAMNDMRMARELADGGYGVDSFAAQKRIADQINALQKEMDSLKKEVDELEKEVKEINDLYEREQWEAAHPIA